MARKPRSASPPRTPRQLCVICAIVEDLADRAQQDLREGRLDDVGQALRQIRQNITGAASVEP